MRIEPYDSSHLSAIVDLSLRAWAPVFESLREAFGDGLFDHFYGGDWRSAQAGSVESVCGDEAIHTWVAVEDQRTVGFVSLKLDEDDRMGEMYMLAVDPDFQRRGIARALTRHSEEWLRHAGMAVVMVETGGDPGHAPARRTYEASGFHRFPVARYFKEL